ncbi:MULTISPECIES: PH domain-containing protein [Synechocystis]|uniref:PH domain-containing protein n=1 Tax=Synechocystis salina LEGE 00031 TaxID=1828736 RepID=A0ABR9VUG0_9SYNC|nr:MULTISPECIES: PH domain-containing protein [Synechocystis]MBD2652995.1 PH domain-containing protein [Synechocystis sp. FACHB-383]MBE9193948.1 PH domain-containing protein [Synechocystis sp. LEGE 06083]MBE9242031.1 PH domain-containing protein [Synechocystis salina LEGE 00041]MBE9254523.1 PH domain-containing protein [Synechocystis salina LEGE 00031]
MGIRETTYYEGGPHIGDLIVNILLGFTVIFLPLTIGAIVRAIWLRYKITDRRISVTGGWMGKDRTDIVYGEVAKMIKMPRGIGIWGDIVVTLNDRSRLELRAMPNFREVYDYMAERVADKTGRPLEAITQK